MPGGRFSAEVPLVAVNWNLTSRPQVLCACIFGFQLLNRGQP
jgi:hypothetical protein